MVVDKTYDQIPMWIANAQRNKAILERCRPLRQVEDVPPYPLIIAGAGPSLDVKACRNGIVFSNQSSAPFLEYHQCPPDYIVISDGGKAVRERMEYLFSAKPAGKHTAIVATHIDPMLLEDMVMDGWEVEYFLHSDFQKQDLTKALVEALPEVENIPMISMVGSVAVASVIVAAMKFPAAPEIFLSGVDFGYPKGCKRQRVPDIRKIELGPGWGPVASKEAGPFIKIFGYDTTPQHVEYYQQLRYVQPAIKIPLRTAAHGILEDIMEYKEVPWTDEKFPT